MPWLFVNLYFKFVHIYAIGIVMRLIICLLYMITYFIVQYVMQYIGVIIRNKYPMSIVLIY